jgi:curved DNA-binding protein CbpA
MNYFKNIESLADLKKQYRALALANHPDRGGDTLVMQEINLQFEKLYAVWELVKTEIEIISK